MSEQSVNYVVSATDTASPVFDKVDKSIAKTTGSTGKLMDTTGRARITQMNFNRVVQDAPFGFIAIQNNIDPLISSFQALRLEANSTGGAFKALAKSFMGPAGMISIISLVVSGITAYMMATRGANKETKGLSAELKIINSSLGKTIEVLSPLSGSKIKFGSMQELKDTIKQLGLMAGISTATKGLYLPGEAGQAELYKEITENFKTRINLTDIQIKIYDEYIKKLKESVEVLKIEEEIRKIISKLQKDSYQLIAPIARGLTTQPGLKMPTSVKGAGTKFKPVVSPGWGIEDLKKEFPALNVVANSFVDTFRQNFIGAWEDAFGRANSLFEQLWQNIAGGLMDAFSQSVSNSIFTFLAASIGLPIGRSVSGGGTQIVIENKLGEDTFERGVYKSYGGASQRYKKVYRG